MPYEIKVPELGESIVEATVASWLKNEGDKVSVGETIVELETDKVDVDVAAEKSGVIKNIQKKEGEDVKIGDVLGTIDESGGDGEEPQKKQEEEEEQTKQEEKITEHESQPPEKESKKEEEPEERDEKEKDDRTTPLAAKLIEEHNVDIDKVKGTGPGGRITKSDIEKFLKPEDGEKTDKDKEAKKPAEPRPAAERGEKRVRMSRRRQTIAKRLVEAQRTAAILTTFNEIDMSKVMEIRNARKDAFEERHGIKLGFMSFFVKAAISALKEFPEINAEIQENEIVYKYYYDIGIAVGAEEGLVVPVLRDADKMSFADIEKKIRELAQKAEDGKLTLDELKGGTFSITNGGRCIRFINEHTDFKSASGWYSRIT